MTRLWRAIVLGLVLVGMFGAYAAARAAVRWWYVETAGGYYGL